jgi:hypothetical protein
MLVEMATGTLQALAGAPGLRVQRISVTLPVEVELRRTGDRTDLLCDLPSMITRTAFDIKPSRLVLVCEEGEWA